MTKKEQYEEKTWELIQPFLEELGLTGVDAEFVKEGDEYSLRIYADRDGGIGIDDCEALSRLIDPALDEADFIEEPYTLIVSSPGLGRAIVRPRDFIFAKDKEVEASFYRAYDGKKSLKGILRSWNEDSIGIETDGGVKEFPRKSVSKLHLALDF